METTIPFNSALAIMDRALRKAELEPRYIWQEYLNTLTKEKETGLLLEGMENFTFILPEEQKDNVGVLGFVNGKEPGDGSEPLEAVFPVIGDELAMAFIIQGIYKGDFGQLEEKGKIVGAYPILTKHKVTEEDLEKKEYTLSIARKDEIKAVNI